MCSNRVMNIFKITFMALAALTLLAALVLNVLAGTFPNWMEVDIVIDNQVRFSTRKNTPKRYNNLQRHAHGLWMYCVGPIDSGNPTGDAARCYPKKTSDDMDITAHTTHARAHDRDHDLKRKRRLS